MFVVLTYLNRRFLTNVESHTAKLFIFNYNFCSRAVGNNLKKKTFNKIKSIIYLGLYKNCTESYAKTKMFKGMRKKRLTTPKTNNLKMSYFGRIRLLKKKKLKGNEEECVDNTTVSQGYSCVDSSMTTDGR